MGRGCPIIAVLALMCSAACSPVEDPPLPMLEAPADLSDRHQVLYLHAHLEQFIRSMQANDDVRFDDARLFTHHQFFLMCCELYAWERSLDVGGDNHDYELKQRLLALTPEAFAYRGARRRAVALGLLAESVWLNDPPRVVPTEDDLIAKARGLATMQPRRYPDTLEWNRAFALQRMIYMAYRADAALFHKQLGLLLAKKARE